MIVSMDKKYTLDGELTTILTVTKPGKWPVAANGLDGSLSHFTADGTHAFSGSKLVEVSPYADFVIDEPVMVRDYFGSKWERRYFAGVNVEGGATAWDNGATKWATELSPTAWNQCRRPTAEELST